MIGAIDGKSIANSPSEQKSRQKSLGNAKSALFLTICIFPTDRNSRSAKKAAEEAIATKISSGSSSKIVVPGTPRHAGIGAGSRVTQTPRRRAGI